ncbi:MAG: hypothetical protein EBY16_02105 [Gammaproteobacteria bacterium]|nr:hypothetical protein [Gammaproteobacteria bacterium]
MMRQGLNKIAKCSVIVGASFLLTGCIMLLLGGPSQFEMSQLLPSKNKEVQPRAYTMRGFLDVFSTGMDSLAVRIHDELHIRARSLSYHEEKKLANFLIRRYQEKQDHSPIILIGHSYGADDQITLAKRLNKANVPVALLISLDNTKKQTIPPNVAVFYNINSGQSMVSWLVPWGTPLTPSSKYTKMVTVNLVKDKHFYRVNHFNIDKLPEVQDLIIHIIKQQVLLKG